jgi:hypothetical protein
MAKFLHKKNTYASAGISTRFLTASPAAMISFPYAVVKYL